MHHRRQLAALISVAATFLALNPTAAGEAQSTAASPADRAERIVERLSLNQQLGQRLVYPLDGLSVPATLKRRLEAGRAAGVILFDRNIASSAQLRRLTASIQRHARRGPGRLPALIMVDQEGGGVRRIAGPPELSAEAMGAQLSRTEIRAQGKATGKLLAGRGVNVDLAPVADLGIRGGAIRREHRAFAAGPAGVTAAAGAFSSGLRRRGVAATAKHFPGFGRAAVNTDTAPGEISRSAAQKRDDLRPFRALIRKRIELIMLSTAIYPEIDKRHPAAISRPISGRLLRRRLDFKGVSITDALDTPTLDAYGSPEKVTRAALGAGTDLLTYASAFRHALRADRDARRALHSGALDRGGLKRSAKRVLTLRARLAKRR